MIARLGLTLLGASAGCGSSTTELGRQDPSVESGALLDDGSVPDGSDDSLDSPTGCPHASPTPPTTLVGMSSASSLLLDQGMLYWTETGPLDDAGIASFSIRSIGVSGGTPQVVVDSIQSRGGPPFLALFGGMLYWVFNPDVYSVDLVGGALAQLAHYTNPGPTAPFAGTGVCPSSIVVDGSGVYISDSCSNSIATPSPSGGNEHVLYTSTLGGIYSLAINPDFIYFAEGPAISRMKRDGSGVSVVFPGQPGSPYSHDLAIDATSMYWTTVDDEGDGGAVVDDAGRKLTHGTLKKANLDGTAVTTLYTAPAKVGLRVMTTDSAFVYFEADVLATMADRMVVSDIIVKVPKSGGCPVTLAEDHDIGLYSAIAVDDQFVYWTNGSAATSSNSGIKRVPK